MSDAPASPFDVVDRLGPVAIFRSGPKPRGPSDHHGALDVDGERVAVLVQLGPAWPMPEYTDRGRALLALRDRNVARCFASERMRTRSGERWCHVVERVGGVALPALVRRVRKRAGTLPPATAARIVRDLCVVQGHVEASAPRARPVFGRYWSSTGDVAAAVADSVVAWDGRVVVAPRVFGTAPDAPHWLHRPSIVAACGALLYGLLAPELDPANVDAALLHALQERTPLTGTGVAALEGLAMRALAVDTPPRARRRAARRGEPAPELDAPALARALDDVLASLGTTAEEDERFAASLMAEVCGDRKRADLAWREELSAIAL